jgi:hypothetical protein
MAAANINKPFDAQHPWAFLSIDNPFLFVKLKVMAIFANGLYQ